MNLTFLASICRRSERCPQHTAKTVVVAYEYTTVVVETNCDASVRLGVGADVKFYTVANSPMNSVTSGIGALSGVGIDWVMLCDVCIG